MTQNQIEYTVVMIRPGYCPELYKKIKDSLTIAKNAYATEMSLLTNKNEIFYKIEAEDGPEATYCIAVDKNNNVLGFIYTEADIRTMTLWTSHVYVRPEVRKNGVYSLMMKRVLKFAKDCQFNRVFSMVHEDNIISQCAHIGTGFKNKWHGYEIDMRETEDD